MKKETFAGKIWSGTQGENDNALFIGYSSTPFADTFQQFNSKQVTVRYWVSDKEKTKSELLKDTILRISGSVDADYGDAYSELTGYLWTDEKLNVGGHDLLSELRSSIDKFLYMEVDY